MLWLIAYLVGLIAVLHVCIYGLWEDHPKKSSDSFWLISARLTVWPVAVPLVWADQVNLRRRAGVWFRDRLDWVKLMLRLSWESITDALMVSEFPPMNGPEHFNCRCSMAGLIHEDGRFSKPCEPLDELTGNNLPPPGVEHMKVMADGKACWHEGFPTCRKCNTERRTMAASLTDDEKRELLRKDFVSRCYPGCRLERVGGTRNWVTMGDTVTIVSRPDSKTGHFVVADKDGNIHRNGIPDYRYWAFLSTGGVKLGSITNNMIVKNRPLKDILIHMEVYAESNADWYANSRYTPPKTPVKLPKLPQPGKKPWRETVKALLKEGKTTYEIAIAMRSSHERARQMVAKYHREEAIKGKKHAKTFLAKRKAAVVKSHKKKRAA